MLEKDFLPLCNKALLGLATNLEEQDKNSALDVDYADGILTIELEKTSQTYVINRNTASQKIWYSSPISGADYFSYDEKTQSWLDTKGKNLSEKLFAELTEIL